jgi:hypothetical protein
MTAAQVKASAWFRNQVKLLKVEAEVLRIDRMNQDKGRESDKYIAVLGKDDWEIMRPEYGMRDNEHYGCPHLISQHLERHRDRRKGRAKEEYICPIEGCECHWWSQA